MRLPDVPCRFNRMCRRHCSLASAQAGPNAAPTDARTALNGSAHSAPPGPPYLMSPSHIRKPHCSLTASTSSSAEYGLDRAHITTLGRRTLVPHRCPPPPPPPSPPSSAPRADRPDHSAAMVMCIPAVRAAQQNQNSPCASRRVRSDYGLSSAKALELAAKKKQQQRRVSAPARLQRLPRPAPTLPSRAVLEAVDPALADVPTDYIRDMLAETGARSVAPLYVLLGSRTDVRSSACTPPPRPPLSLCPHPASRPSSRSSSPMPLRPHRHICSLCTRRSPAAWALRRRRSRFTRSTISSSPQHAPAYRPCARASARTRPPPCPCSPSASRHHLPSRSSSPTSTRAARTPSSPASLRAATAAWTCAAPLPGHTASGRTPPRSVLRTSSCGTRSTWRGQPSPPARHERLEPNAACRGMYD
jgi:hypothetical protein